MHREKWAKRERGVEAAYVIEDRLGQWLFLGQKLPALRCAVNTIGARDDMWARVSTNALWECVGRADPPYCKGRWTVTRLELESARKVWEKARAFHERAVIVGQPNCYEVDVSGV